MRDVIRIESLEHIIELAAVEILQKFPTTADIYNALAETMIGQAIQYFGLVDLSCQRSQANAA